MCYQCSIFRILLGCCICHLNVQKKIITMSRTGRQDFCTKYCHSAILAREMITDIIYSVLSKLAYPAFPKLFLNIALLNNLLIIKRSFDKKAKAILSSISDNHNLKRRLTLMRRMSLVQFRQLLDIRFDFSQKQS